MYWPQEIWNRYTIATHPRMVSEFGSAPISYPYRQECVSKAECELGNVMRRLWFEHVAWTRMVITSIAAGSPDEKATTDRLLRNAPDMANALKPFYGEQNASIIEKLIIDHLVIAAQLVKAAKAGNTAAAANIEKRWYDNANDIAVFMNRINPYWTLEPIRSMWFEHLALTKSEAVHRLNKEFTSDIEAFDKIEQQALEMADMFTKGIVNQFPMYFQCAC